MISYNNAAPKAVNNVGQFGATEGSIGAYKSAAEYAADARYWALLSQTKYTSVEDILAEVERLYAQGLLLEEDIKQLKSDFETQQQELLGLIQSTVTAIDNTNAATELSKEATQEVLAQLDVISNMTVQTTLLPPGSLATGSYDNLTGEFSFGIPEGKPGRDGTDGTVSDIGSVPVGSPVTDDYGFYVDKDNGGLYRANMSDIANLVPSIRSISINGGEEQTGAVSFNSVSSFNSRTGDVVSEVGDYSVEQITGAAKIGANSDITSLSGLTTALSIQQGGTGAKNADDARTNLGLGSVATHSVVPIDKGGTGATSASGARTNLGLGLVATESIVPVTKGGTGSTSAENARLALVAAKSGVNSDITSMTNGVTFTQPVSVADAVDATNAVNLGQISSGQGASLIGTLEGVPVQNIISNINTDIIQLKLNWAIENGYSDAGFTFTTGGTLTVDDRDKVVYDPVSKEWYSYSGTLPVVIPAGFNPVGNADWKTRTDPYLREDLAGPFGFSLIGVVDNVPALRNLEPQFEGQRVVVASHTSGYNLGGGIFRAALDGSGKTDNNGTVIKTSGGSVWLRENKSEVYAVDFGFIPNDSALAASNATAVVAAAKYAFDIGSVCVLPPGMAYVGGMIFNFPANIRGSHPGSGASLVQRNQTSDLIHTGSGYCFDFPPQLRPNVPADTQDVVDGICLTNINIRGTNSGLGGIRVNTAGSINTVGYERRNTTFSNIKISGYYSGWGYQLFNTFTNHLFNVTVWDCAAIYYIRTSHSTDHVSCVYENCAWGCLAINTECNNHIGGAIEGVRYLSKMTKPVDYDENGNFPTDLGYSQLYAGIGIRTRGGTTLLSGVYLEANKIDMHLEDSCKVTARDCYFNAVSGRTEFNTIGTSGSLLVQGCRFVNAPTSGIRWRKNSGSLLCSHAIITQNQYDSLRPASAPDIANVGEFDVYPGTPDLNAVTRIMKSQNTLTSGSTTNTTLTVGSTVVLSGLTTDIPTTTGQLYVDSNGVVKRKQ